MQLLADINYLWDVIVSPAIPHLSKANWKLPVYAFTGTFNDILHFTVYPR